ncbi:MAG: THUMP domain-containing protein, partial [Atopobiaceae bacterium]|nr:THUMP domain-containing protein [Atopobiaceae bacterium]
MVNNDELELFARCASGFEKILADELKGLGMRRVRPLKGGVAFFGQLKDAYRACLWSRVATRVQLVITRVPAKTADTLYDAVAAFAWEDHIPSGATVAVDAHGQNEALRNTKFTALKVKDAVCDRLRRVRGARPNVDAHDPDFSLNVALHAQKATLYLNLSGPSLHRRGYREDGVQTEAPLKETLAAGLLLAADWPATARQGGVLVDPMCGSGTLAVEGALMATNRAPGLLRERWGFEGWALHDAERWGRVLTSAYEAIDDTADALVLAGDIDASAVNIARQNVRRAGVESVVRLFVDDAARLGRHLR